MISPLDQNIIILEQNYVIHKQLSKGKIYNLYLAINLSDRSKYYLVKIKRASNSEGDHEISFINKLKEGNLRQYIANCIPKLITQGDQYIKGQLYTYQIWERQGPSLKMIHKYHRQNIPLSVLCVIAIQTLTCLERLHYQMIVHRNLRPKKIITTKSNEVLLSDLKFACNFKKQASDSYKTDANLNVHLGQCICKCILAPSPKDDLESLAYVLIVLMNKGNCLKYHDTNRIKKLEMIKTTLIPEKDFKGVPLEFVQFLNMVRTSNLTDYPCQYDKFKLLFRKVLSTLGLKEQDVSFQWLTNSSLSVPSSSPSSYNSSEIREANSMAENETDEIEEDCVQDEPICRVSDKINQIPPLESKLIMKLNDMRKQEI